MDNNTNEQRGLLKGPSLSSGADIDEQWREQWSLGLSHPHWLLVDYGIGGWLSTSNTWSVVKRSSIKRIMNLAYVIFDSLSSNLNLKLSIRILQSF